MSKLSNERTIARFKEMEQAYMRPKHNEIAKRVGINKTVLSSYLNGNRELSHENMKKLNLFLDKRLTIIQELEKEKV